MRGECQVHDGIGKGTPVMGDVKPPSAPTALAGPAMTSIRHPKVLDRKVAVASGSLAQDIGILFPVTCCFAPPAARCDKIRSRA